ncbi:hypothetical protein HBI81_158340 [Parastagonospora nodorum]|nr:hypothetical protein HBI10_076050 [Parastagonospora nodorum]KAH4025947.1 hypothetical protein HBI13_071860 [Parastagonospora nodorum]KAH4062523.1 hypothetical protein HBH50_204370 [Parastagonospora nodorum]KAH4081078.1 hypothetical protein HBH48_200010 [Parastagonospora nodorum]KAH4106174.1 hypothetical protein HBH46_073720 [Parastagonospora nodorum]
MATDWNCCKNSRSVPHLRSNPYSTRRCSNITGKKVKNKMGQLVNESGMFYMCKDDGLWDLREKKMHY